MIWVINLTSQYSVLQTNIIPAGAYSSRLKFINVHAVIKLRNLQTQQLYSIHYVTTWDRYAYSPPRRKGEAFLSKRLDRQSLLFNQLGFTPLNAMTRNVCTWWS